MLATAACQGNIGTGGGLPQPPGPQITAIAGAQSRTRSTDGAVFLDSEMKTIPLPEVGGFSITILLEAPTPAPSGASSAAAGISPLTGARLVTGSPAPAQMPTPPAPSPSGSAAPRAAASPGALVSGAPATPRSALAVAKPKAAATPSGPKVDTKTTIYPEDAPPAPAPQPTGNVQSFPHRTALVRGWVMPRTPVTLYSLAAARFTIPPLEQTKGRGFTISLFESLKHRKNRLLASDPAAVFSDNAISAATVASEPIVLKKNVGYYFVLYGDDLGPVPTPSGSFPPATNPLLSGSPPPGTLIATPTPLPGITPFPVVTPNTPPR